MFKLKRTLFSLPILLAVSMPSVAAPLKILPLGDSITSGSHSSSPYLAYRDELYDKLKYAGYEYGTDYEFVGTEDASAIHDGVNLVHEGHHGDHADHIEDDLAGYLANYSVDVALVHIGTNDINNHLRNTVPTTDARTLEDIEEIITGLKAKNASMDIFIAKLLPHHSNGSGVFTAVDNTAGLNALLTPAWALQQGVTLVDQNTNFTYATDLDAGFVHPTIAGEVKMADNWYSAIESILPTVTVATPPVTTGMTVHLDAADVDGDGSQDVVTSNVPAIAAGNKANTNPNDDFTLVPGSIAPNQLTNSEGLNGKSVLDFAGSGLQTTDYGQISDNSSYTKFAVVRLDNFGTKNNIVASNPYATTLWTDSDSQYKVRANHDDPIEESSILVSSTHALTGEKYHRVVFRYDTAAAKNTLFVDGVGTDSTASALHASSSVRTSIGSIGAGSYLDGKVAEVIVYDRALTNAEITQVDTYLNAKWFNVEPASVDPELIISSLPTAGVGSYTITADSLSDGDMTYSTSGSCTNVDEVVTITASGASACTVSVEQASYGVYTAASDDLDLDVSSLSQILKFTAASNVTFSNAILSVSAISFDGPTTLIPTGLPVTIAVLPISSSVCSIDASNQVTLKSAGDCTLQASQSGTASYAAVSEETTIVITKADQTTTLSAQSAAVVGTSFDITASTDSDLTVFSFDTTTAGVCTVSGSTVTAVAAGACLLTATQAGDVRYNADTSEVATVTVSVAELTPSEAGLAAVVATISNGSEITAAQLNAIDGISGAKSDISYTAAIQAGTYVDPSNPTVAEILAVVTKANEDSIDSGSSGGGAISSMWLFVIGFAAMIRRKGLFLRS